MKLFTWKVRNGYKRLKFLNLTLLRFGKKRSDAYGHFDIIEQYYNIKLPQINAVIQHGWYMADAGDFNTPNIKIFFAWSKRIREAWIKITDIPCYVLGAPFALYRRLNNIKQDSDASGTIAYPAHAVHTSKPNFDVDAYCRELLNLPEEYHPITISVHRTDIECFELDKIYKKYGFRVFCANYSDKPFNEAFYDELRKHKYATSNEVGSYTFYTIEMGIPFFLLGQLPSRGSNNGVITDGKYGKIAIDLLTGIPRNIITQELKDFVESELGINDSISKEELQEAIKILSKI